MMPDPKPLLKLAKLWEAMRPADREVVAREVARQLVGDVEAEDIDIGRAAREAAQLVQPDGRKMVRDAGFDHAVTVAVRIWVVERGNPYSVGHFHRNTNYNQPYVMQEFVSEAVERALPKHAISRRALVNKPVKVDVLRIVDSSIWLQNQRLKRSRKQ